MYGLEYENAATRRAATRPPRPWPPHVRRMVLVLLAIVAVGICCLFALPPIWRLIFYPTCTLTVKCIDDASGADVAARYELQTDERDDPEMEYSVSELSPGRFRVSTNVSVVLQIDAVGYLPTTLEVGPLSPATVVVRMTRLAVPATATTPPELAGESRSATREGR